MSARDLAALEKRLREEPENLGLRVMLAGALLEAGRSAEALDLYRSVAIAYRDQGRIHQALAVCRSILELVPDDAVSQSLMATLGVPPTPAPPTLPAQSPPARRPSTVSSEATPLPAPMPYHVADPTTGTIKKLSDLDLEADLVRTVREDRGDSTERVERLYPVDTDTEEEPSPHALPEPPPAIARTSTPATLGVLTNAFFAPIPLDRRAAIVAKLIRRTFTAGTIILHRGEVTHPLLLVLAGTLETRGPTSVLETHTAGDHVGECSLLARKPSTIEVVAASDADVMLLTPRDFYDIAGAFPALWSMLKEVAARRTRTGR